MKKAILVVSFGTSFKEALEKSILKVEKRIQEAFNEYDVFRSFTAHRIIKKLKEKYDMDILMPEDALEKLYNEGYEEVIVQPLHIMPGEEFQYVTKVKDSYKDKFESLKLGRPIFYYQGIEGLPQDYTLFIQSIEKLLKENKASVLVGHGSPNPSNSVYGCLQTVLEDEGYENVFVGTVNGYPTVETVIKRIKKRGLTEVTLIPLMLVAGKHALNDIAIEKEGSWKSRLESEGIRVNIHMEGLGESEGFNELFINRIKDLKENRYIGVGETKKGHR